MAIRRDPYDPSKLTPEQRQQRVSAALGAPAAKKSLPVPAPSYEFKGRYGPRPYLLTTPEMRQARLAHLQAMHARRGGNGLVKPAPAPETAADSFLAPEAHAALTRFLRAYLPLERPGVGALKNSGVPQPEEVSRAERCSYLRVWVQLTPRQRNFIAWLAQHEYAARFDGPSALCTGGRLVNSSDKRRGLGGLDGYLACLADSLQQWYAQLDTAE